MRHLRASERPVDIRVITQPFQRQWNGEPEQHLGKAGINERREPRIGD